MDAMSLLERIRGSSPERQLLVVLLAVVLMVGLLSAAYFFVLRRPYDVLFTKLRAMDAATIVAELDKKKVPYRLKEGGTTILVPANLVDTTRLSVMSADLPLKGMVGFELFNKSDMGLTEFAQRINYQRALQGELARTIMTMDSVDTARVHLSITEPTVFRGDRRPPKASVTILTRPGARLSEGTVRGIQRLVAAAVPDLELSNVVVLGPKGEAQTGEVRADQGGASPAGERQAVEHYYAAQIREALAKAFPAGTMHVAVTAEDAAPADGQAINTAPRGSTATIGEPRGTDMAAGDPVDLGNPLLDAHDYRLRVAVSVNMPITADLEAGVREIVGRAIGAEGGLGDTVTVSRASEPWSESGVGSEAVAAGPESAGRSDWDLASPRGFWMLVLVPALLLLLVFAARLHRAGTQPRKLTARQRDDYVRRLTVILDKGEPNASRAI